MLTFAALGKLGRFCNAMFQIAGVFGVARKLGYKVGFPLFINYDHRDRFGSQEDIDVYKHFVNPLPVYDGPPLPEYAVPWGYHDLRVSDNVSLWGHFQSRKYFKHCFEEIKYYFKMKDEYEKNDYTAIHCRLGDYDNAYHPRLGMDYYGKAMEQFPKSTKFLVFSDDIDDCKKMFNGTRDIEYSEGRDYIDDFKLMKSCKEFIIGNSSYSAMAAILAESKRVVAPAADKWFGPIAKLDAKDIYNDDWIQINF